ncbi:MAG: ammonium transporter [Pseudomonadota bacterium]
MDEQLFDIIWVLIAAVLVLMMQGGFLCLESGLTRAKNAINVGLKNVVDLSVAIVLFWGIGFGVMFGTDLYGLIGIDGFFPEIGGKSPWDSTFFLFQAVFCATATTIVAGAIAERTRFMTYVVIAVLVTSFIYPIFGHWSWGSLHGGTGGWLEERGFVDFAGSTVVHSLGGWVALAMVILVGPRQGRFRDNVVNNVPPSNLPLCMLGLLLFFVGWIGFNGGSTLEMSLAIPGIVANTILAGAVGSIAGVAIQRIGISTMDASVAPINGAIAGLVAITAGCHAVTATEAVVIGMGGALAMSVCDRVLVSLRIDDAVGAIPVHLAGGIWGTLAVGIFGDLQTLDTGLDRFNQIVAQLQGIIACGIWAFGVTYVFMFYGGKRSPLRVTPDAEEVGLNVAEHGARTPILDLMEVLERQEATSDLSLRAPIEPFTEVGHIASRYNKVMDTLEATTVRTKQIVADIRDGIITFSPNGILTSLNPGAEKLLVLDAASVVGSPLTTAFVEGGINVDDGFLTTLQRSASSEKRTTCEIERAVPDDRCRVLEMTTFETDDGGEKSFTALLRDVTERREFEEQLFTEKELAQVTLESLGEGTATANRRFVSYTPVSWRKR